MNYDFTVIGAGIVGLSTAWKLTNAYPEARILVLEKENRVAAHQTGHNSGVIHSGIYYKPGSYRAKNCVDGRHQLVEFCRTFDITFDLCGKIIVATGEEELPRLENIYQRGIQNNIEGIELVGEVEIGELEPRSAGLRAIHVPCAGIVDFIGVSEKLRQLVEEKGGSIQFDSKVTGIYHRNGSIEVATENDKFNTGHLIGCAGLYSDRVAKSAGVRSPVQIVPFRGEYFELIPEVENWVRGLIYPLPNPEFPFLGVHFTRMATGGVECGPNAVFAFKREGYEKLSFDLGETIETINFPGFWKLAGNHWRMGLDEYYRSFSKRAFVKQLQKLIPEIQTDHLRKSPAGVRAMALKPNGEILDDFHFERNGNELHVLNAPSPAATAALAIGDEIVKQLTVNI
jgi:(S)-2-hydroxyglutarate dehydrogenase